MTLCLTSDCVVSFLSAVYVDASAIQFVSLVKSNVLFNEFSITLGSSCRSHFIPRIFIYLFLLLFLFLFFSKFDFYNFLLRRPFLYSFCDNCSFPYSKPREC